MDLIYRYDPYQPITSKKCSDSEEARQSLSSGNDRFAHVVELMQKETMGETAAPVVIPISPMSLGLPMWSGVAPAQSPFALVLGCSDARVPIESIFDQAHNDLFVIRIAGNVLGVECLGSVDYAVRHFGGSLRLVVVLGHSGCGAVTAAVDTYLSVTDYADIVCTHALRSLVDRIMIAVRGAAKSLERLCGSQVAHAPGYRTALLEMAIYLNAAITAYDLGRELEALHITTMQVVYGIYDLGNLRVRALPMDAGPGPALGDAPVTAEDLMTLGHKLAETMVARGMVSK